MIAKKKTGEVSDDGFQDDSLGDDRFNDEENFEAAGFSIHDANEVNLFAEAEDDSLFDDEEEDDDEFDEFSDKGDGEEEGGGEEKDKNKDEENLENDPFGLFGLDNDDPDKYQAKDRPLDNYEKDEEEIL